MTSAVWARGYLLCQHLPKILTTKLSQGVFGVKTQLRNEPVEEFPTTSQLGKSSRLSQSYLHQKLSKNYQKLMATQRQKINRK